MRVLVTGGGGFIGSHLCDTLVERGDLVTALDDFSGGAMANLSGALASRQLRAVRGSAEDADLVEDLVASADAVVHLASPVGVRRITAEPLASLRSIIHGSEVVLEAASRRRTTVLLASTSEVYGRNPGLLHEDADRVLGPTSVPRWSYAAGKAVEEHLAFGYAAEHGVPAVVLRFFNVAGPRQSGRWGMVLPRFVTRALHGEDLLVYGDGSQRRCFCHVADAVRAVVALLDEPSAAGSAFNVASTEEIAVADLARRVIEQTGSSSSLRFAPFESVYGERFEDVDRRRPDIRRIRTLTGWEPTRSLETIIHDVAGWVESQRRVERSEAS